MNQRYVRNDIFYFVCLQDVYKRQVSDIKRANYSELFPSEEEAADRWFKCKLVFITLDRCV